MVLISVTDPTVPSHALRCLAPHPFPPFRIHSPLPIKFHNKPCAEVPKDHSIIRFPVMPWYCYPWQIIQFVFPCFEMYSNMPLPPSLPPSNKLTSAINQVQRFPKITASLDSLSCHGIAIRDRSYSSSFHASRCLAPDPMSNRMTDG